MPIGGSDPQIDNNVKAIDPPWLKGTGVMSLQQAMPGQLNALARDLAMGGYGNQSANMNFLDRIYDPTRTLDYYPPAKKKTGTTTTVKPTVKPTAKPTDPTIVTRRGSDR